MEGVCAVRRLTSNWQSVTIVDRVSQSLTTIKIVIAIFLFLLSGIPNVSSQQNPYAPEIDYSCVEVIGRGLEVEYEYEYEYIKCTISNNNPHDITVKISEEWEHNVDGLYESSEGWGERICAYDADEIGREIIVQASSEVVFCHKISADKYAAEGIYIFTSTAEVVRYSAIIPCDVCEPVDEEVQIEIHPWYTIIPDYSAIPESAYSYNHDESERIMCDKSDFSELLLELTADGNFLGTKNFSVDFSFQIIIRDLSLDDYVEYRESTFGEVNLEYDSEPLTFEVGETVQRIFKASWDIKEDTDNYDVQLLMRVDVYNENDKREGKVIDFCPSWEGVQEIKLNNDSSGITVNLNSPFSISLSIISIVMAAAIIRKN
ncbi:MAG: hypothetical protein CL973_02975 [Euryarchaeota archaeon]|nr:hypothetical protein [Euryarchaeota archaeon]